VFGKRGQTAVSETGGNKIHKLNDQQKILGNRLRKRKKNLLHGSNVQFTGINVTCSAKIAGKDFISHTADGN